MDGDGLYGQHRRPRDKLDIERSIDESRRKELHVRKISLPSHSFLKAGDVRNGVLARRLRRTYKIIGVLYQRLSGKWWPSTAAAVCASRGTPIDIRPRSAEQAPLDNAGGLDTGSPRLEAVDGAPVNCAFQL